MNYVNSNVLRLSFIALEIFSKDFFYFVLIFLIHSLADEKTVLYLIRPKASNVFCIFFFKDLVVKIQLVYDLYCEYSNKDDLKELQSKRPILRDAKWLNKFLDYTLEYSWCRKQHLEDFKL